MYSIATKKRIKLAKKMVRELSQDEGSVVGGGAKVVPVPPRPTRPTLPATLERTCALTNDCTRPTDPTGPIVVSRVCTR
jgi:hypothetical protein